MCFVHELKSSMDRITKEQGTVAYVMDSVLRQFLNIISEEENLPIKVSNFRWT